MPPKGGGSDGPKAIRRATNSIDRAIGKQLKHYRTAAGISEDDCAKRIGVSVATLDAYERAKERVPASHLSLLAAMLGVPVEAFFERLTSKPQTSEADNVVALPRPRKGRALPPANMEVHLLKSFRALQHDRDRQLVMDIAARLAEQCCSASGS